MKTIAGIFGLTVVALSATAQEYDDMYFRKKDREKIKASSTDAYASNHNNFRKKHFGDAVEQNNNVNPTDSYSGRHINPEYVSRANAEQAREDEQNYFIGGYTPASNLSNFSNTPGYFNSMNTAWFQPGWFGPMRFNNWYSPYFGYYDPWMNPFYGVNPGWGFSNFWGPWGSGWNFSIGYSWENIWCSNLWWPSWTAWNYPYIIYYVGSERTRVTYGKRPSSNQVVPGNVRNHYTTNSVNNNPSGRTRGNDEYYVRPSRRTSSETSSYNPGNTSNESRWYPRGTQVYSPSDRNTGYRESRPATYSSPSRSNSFNSGGTRSSAPSSGSRSRGRD